MESNGNSHGHSPFDYGFHAGHVVACLHRIDYLAKFGNFSRQGLYTGILTVKFFLDCGIVILVATYQKYGQEKKGYYLFHRFSFIKSMVLARHSRFLSELPVTPWE